MLRRMRGNKLDESKGVVDESEVIISDSFSSLLKKQHKTSSIFSLPSLLVGFSKGLLSDNSDCGRSPTSILDARGVFSASPIWSSGKSEADFQQKQQRKCLVKGGVGLGIFDSLDDESDDQIKLINSNEKISFSDQGMRSESRKIVFGVKLNVSSIAATSPKSLPEGVLFDQKKFDVPNLGVSHFAANRKNGYSSEVGSRSENLRSFSYHEIVNGCLSPSIDNAFHCRNPKNKLKVKTSGSPCLIHGASKFCPNKSSYGSPNGEFSVSDIENSEDYTCVISHGPNAKTTHIYGDFIFEENNNIFEINPRNPFEETGDDQSRFVMDDFLSVCAGCKLKLMEGEDIYMYRGEKGFCSPECRDQEIMKEEKFKEKVNHNPERLAGRSSGLLCTTNK